MKAEKFNSQELSPEEIKKLRQTLNLTQAEAGKLLGGGPSAFAKYENGSVKPSLALTKILRFLKERPEELRAMSGYPTPAKAKAVNPLEVAAANVSELIPRDLSTLVEKLLSAEAQAWNLPLNGIHVASELTAPDGGEDARIEWRGGPKRTDFFPNRFCQFQLKSGDMSPGKAGKEILDSKGRLKPMVREALERGGSYVMVCSKPYTQQAIEKRIEGIRKNTEIHGIREPHVCFYDSSKIASWVNSHPSVAAWLLRKTRPGLVSSFFGDWEHWSQRSEHSNSSWIEDSRLADLRKNLRAIVESPRGAAHVVGTAGSGKSRLVLEALGPTEEEKTSGIRLKDLVLYAVESEADSSRIKEYAWNLVNSQRRAVLVIDRCSEQTRVDLANIARHSNSNISVVTISCEISRVAAKSENTLAIKPPHFLLVENIVRWTDPEIVEWDRERIIEFSQGNIKCARTIAATWHKKGLTASVDEEPLVRELIGYDGPEPVYEVAGLISVFGEVATEVVDEGQLEFEQFSDWVSGGDLEPAGGVERETEADVYNESELEQVVRFADGLSVTDFRRAVERLKRREIVHEYGDRLILEPKRVAVSLAKLQWKKWNPRQWEEILVGPLHEPLRTRAAGQLSLLYMEETAKEIAALICRKREDWYSLEKLARNSVILGSLTDINPEKVLRLLENVIDPMTPSEIQAMGGEARYNILTALSKAGFAENTIESVSGLLLKLACGEDKIIDHEAANQFISLFPARLASAADGPRGRLRAIDGLLERYDENSDVRLCLVVDALLEGAKIRGFHRTVGHEIQGGRPSRNSWEPKNPEEYWCYVKQFVSRLVEFAKRPDHIGEKVRGGLGHYWCAYVLDGLIEDVERWTEEVIKDHEYWPASLRSFENLLKHEGNKLPDSTRKKLKNLAETLRPQDIDHRIELLIMDAPHDRCGELEDIAMELLSREEKLRGIVSGLCEGAYCMARPFGKVLAKKAPDPLHWKTQTEKALELVPEGRRNINFLIGYMEGLKERDPEEFAKFKTEASKSPVFASVLPNLTLYAGISPQDVELVTDALAAGLIQPEKISKWNYSEEMRELAPREIMPLFDFMLRSQKSFLFGAAMGLMCSYTQDREDLLEHLRPLLRVVAKYPSIRKEGRTDGSPARADSLEIDGFEGFFDLSIASEPYSHTRSYEILMEWLISKGSGDLDARAVAIAIAEQVGDERLSFNDEETIRRRLPLLFSNFAEIVWPIVGRIIEKNTEKAAWISMILRDGAVTGDKRSPILSVPENILFGWCYSCPEIGPAFLARAVPVLESDEQGDNSLMRLHPIISRILDEFGNRDDVLNALEESIYTFTWSGPVEIYFARYKKPVLNLREHDKEPVRRWARKMLGRIDDEIHVRKRTRE